MHHPARILNLAVVACCVAGQLAVCDFSVARDRQTLATHVKFPVIPPEARAKHLTGSGIIVVYIRANGTVQRAEVARSSGHKILDDAALAAFSQWQFIPGKLKKAEIPFTFMGKYEKPKTSNQTLESTASPCTTCLSHDQNR